MPSSHEKSDRKTVSRTRTVRRTSNAAKKTSRVITVRVRTGGRKARVPGKRKKISAGHSVPIPDLHPLVRHEDNPIIEPRADRFWEMRATFNPGAMYADHRVHLLYRAIGGDDISVLGYAASDDGVTIAERSEEPAYVPPVMSEQKTRGSQPTLAAAYFSGGGGNGGCEDPRITLIEDTVYVTYTSFDGWGSIRMALTSLGLEDFLNKRWKWRTPALISPPGQIHKNWVLFPEKINGKFAVLHSISPDIRIDYFESLDDFEGEGKFIESEYRRAPRNGVWDSWIRGAGPPPIKTRLGWLLFYHAMDVRDPNRYKLGAMILDEHDPSHVRYRSRVPILEPNFEYENNGFKTGVVYSCGAVVKDGELYVYYGGGDTVVCVAMANLDAFLDELQAHGEPRLRNEIKK